MKTKYVLSLHETEQKRYEEFKKSHYSKHPFRGGVPVTITPTGIGIHVKVKCPSCGKEKDITNYAIW
jgi:hypothetical protein